MFVLVVDDPAPRCERCREREHAVAEMARSVAEYAARWRWTLRLLAAMPPPGHPRWPAWLVKREAAMRGWDVGGKPPVCPMCRKRVQVLYVEGPWRSCRACWVQSHGTSPTTTAWTAHARVAADP
jgi:hypothetical protein